MTKSLKIVGTIIILAGAAMLTAKVDGWGWFLGFGVFIVLVGVDQD